MSKRFRFSQLGSGDLGNKGRFRFVVKVRVRVLYTVDLQRVIFAPEIIKKNYPEIIKPYMITNPEGVGYHIGLREIEMPSVCLSVCPSRIGSQTTKGVDMNLECH